MLQTTRESGNWDSRREPEGDASACLDTNSLVLLSSFFPFEVVLMRIPPHCVSQFCKEQHCYFNRDRMKFANPSGGMDSCLTLVYLIPQVEFDFYVSCQSLSVFSLVKLISRSVCLSLSLCLSLSVCFSLSGSCKQPCFLLFQIIIYWHAAMILIFLCSFWILSLGWIHFIGSKIFGGVFGWGTACLTPWYPPVLLTFVHYFHFGCYLFIYLFFSVAFLLTGIPSTVWNKSVISQHSCRGQSPGDKDFHFLPIQDDADLLDLDFIMLKDISPLFIIKRLGFYQGLFLWVLGCSDGFVLHFVGVCGGPAVCQLDTS